MIIRNDVYFECDLVSWYIDFENEIFAIYDEKEVENIVETIENLQKINLPNNEVTTFVLLNKGIMIGDSSIPEDAPQELKDKFAAALSGQSVSITEEEYLYLKQVTHPQDFLFYLEDEKYIVVKPNSNSEVFAWMNA